MGIVRDACEITEWDGVVRARPQWNRDQTLASAFAVSALWYYQRLARETGEQRMREYVHKIGDGNEDASGGIGHFWLGSSLKISADEQVNFSAPPAARPPPVFGPHRRHRQRNHDREQVR